jgi:hypothetical protein
VRAPAALALLAGLAAALGGCYRVRQAPQIDEPVRVVVISDEARLVQAQAYLQRAVGDSLANRLGWRVSPDGSARLELHIAEERIDATARDSRGVATRWSIRLSGTALLVSQKGNLIETYTGLAYATGILDENEALQKAADNAAFNLANWLQSETRTLR